MQELVPFVSTLASRAAISSVDTLASAAGLEVLQRGGSAVDAAISANAVLAVTTQQSCGLGGDLFALVYEPSSEETPSAVRALNASGRAGSKVSAEALRQEGLTVMPFRGRMESVTVPGCVDGWLALHDRYGKLPFRELLLPAIHYAEEGFPASIGLADSVGMILSLENATEYRAAFARGRKHGTVVRRPGIARTLTSLANLGREGFYGGEFGAELIKLGSEVFSAQDLKEPQAEWVEPLQIGAFSHRLWTAPANSQGYLGLLSAAISELLSLPRDPTNHDYAHILIEASRLAGFDRIDRLFDGADVRSLLSQDEIERRASLFSAKATISLPESYLKGDTTAITAIDEAGLGVVLIQSNAAGFGAHILTPSTQVFLHNRGIGFNLIPMHKGELRKQTRPPHTLSPIIATDKDGGLRALIGSMGGDAQPQILLQLLTRVLHCGQSSAEAVAGGRFILTSRKARLASGFATWKESGRTTVKLEESCPSNWANDLASLGHDVSIDLGEHRQYGHAHVLIKHDEYLEGAADPRSLGGACLGY